MKTHNKAVSLIAFIAGFAGFHSIASAQEVLNVYNWSDYIAEDTIANFEKEFGVKVNYDMYDSTQMVEAKMLAGNSGYDVVVPTLADAERLIKAGLFLKLDKSKLTNYGNLDPAILKQTAKYDPNNDYAVPYLWGTNGIGYNVAKIREVLGDDAPVDSWSLIFDPKYAKEVSKCGMTMLDDPSEVVPLVSAYLGTADAPQSIKSVEAAMAELEKVRPYITYFHSSQYINDLANGNICAAIGWSGDIYMAASRAAEANNGNEIKYTIPKEGTLIWFDTMMIPADAPHPDLAHKFINYILRGDVSAAITNYVEYAGPNLAAMDMIEDRIKNNPGVYPSDEVKERLRSKVEPDAKVLRVRTRLWTKLKTGQ